MRKWMLALSILLLSGAIAAQTPMPGTFNNPPSQSTNTGYIVSPPTISFGNGITPTVITNQDAVTVTLPQNISQNGQTVQTNSGESSNEQTAMASNAGANVDQRIAGQASRNFDFVKAPAGGGGPIMGSMADNSVSLGEVARKARNGKQISKHSITNADVSAMNGTAPGDSTKPGSDANGVSGTSIAAPASQQNGANPTQSTGGAAGAATPPQNRDPFAKPTTTTPSDTTKPNKEVKPQLPQTSSLLPLLGTLGAVSTLAGISYIRFR
jgi:hypothetical protein